MAAAAAAASSAAILSLATTKSSITTTTTTSTSFRFPSPPFVALHHGGRRWIPRTTGICASISVPPVSSKPDELVASIFSKVLQTDRGVLLKRDEHIKVAKAAEELKEFCVDEPVRCPLVFGEWDVVYCSMPTSPGGGYRSALGRLVFKTKEMIQVIEAPDIVKNKVSFSVFGFLDGEVSLKGKLKALDDKWIQVVFEAPELKVGSFEFRYGGESEVKLEITYIDDQIRLGKGSRGSLFVFQRRKLAS